MAKIKVNDKVTIKDKLYKVADIINQNNLDKLSKIKSSR